MVYYHDGVTKIDLRDEVELRGGFIFLFRKLLGRVIYVQGISARNPNMEFNGLQWVAIDVPGKALIKQLVDPDTGRLVKKTKLLRRNVAIVTDAQNSLLNLESDN